MEKGEQIRGKERSGFFSGERRLKLNASTLRSADFSIKRENAILQ